MKIKYLSSCLFGLLLVSCATYDPFVDPKIKTSAVCQEMLTELVELDIMNYVKNLVDDRCNNIVIAGWVKGTLDGRVRPRCKRAFNYLKERPELQRTAKRFIKNSCYVAQTSKYQW